MIRIITDLIFLNYFNFLKNIINEYNFNLDHTLLNNTELRKFKQVNMFKKIVENLIYKLNFIDFFFFNIYDNINLVY